MQHLQAYASMLASLPQATHLAAPYTNLNGIQQAYPNPYTVSPTQSSSSPTSPQQIHTSPLLPFTPYGAQSQHSNNNSKRIKPRPLTTPNSHLFSLFFPGAGTSGSRSEISSGSASPVLDGSPLGNRSRRSTRRVRTKTATQREDGQVLADSSCGGDADGEDGVQEEEEEEEEEAGFSDILADAILKRPESIRDGSIGLTRKENGRGKACMVANGKDGNRTGESEVSLNDHGGEQDGDGWVREPPSVRLIISEVDN